MHGPSGIRASAYEGSKTDSRAAHFARGDQASDRNATRDHSRISNHLSELFACPERRDRKNKFIVSAMGGLVAGHACNVNA